MDHDEELVGAFRGWLDEHRPLAYRELYLREAAQFLDWCRVNRRSCAARDARDYAAFIGLVPTRDAMAAWTAFVADRAG